MKLKDKKIEILAVTNTVNENGFTERTLQAVCPPVWAYFRHLSGKEYYAANTEQVQEEALFIVNYRTDINTTHVIRYKNKLYDITRVDKFEGYKKDITLYCKSRER